MISAAGFNRFHNPLLGLALLCLIAVAPAPGQNPNTNPLENQATKPVEGSQPASASGVNTGERVRLCWTHSSGQSQQAAL